MKILVLGGNRFFGRHLVQRLIERGHEVTVATRGLTEDGFGSAVRRIKLDRTNPVDMKEKLAGKRWDLVYDNIAYCSNDVKYALGALDCGRYILTSTVSVYDDLHAGIQEEEFDPLKKELVWCDRPAYYYGEVKRLAECALFQEYKGVNAAAVRFPVVIRTDDYTGRLKFYIDHMLDGEPMDIEDVSAHQPLITAEEAAHFLEFIGLSDFRGSINICCRGAVSAEDIMGYITRQTGKTPVISRSGEKTPYSGFTDFSLDTRKAEALGFALKDIEEELYGIIDFYIGHKG